MDIRNVQLRLRALGYDPGPIDGLRGPRTDAAIRAFKRGIGFRDRPYLGPLTIKALFAEPSEESNLPWMDVAAQVRGLHETRDRSRLREWFTPSVMWIDPEKVAWCGAFVETCIKRAIPTADTPDNPLGARQWSSFGKPTGPRFGSVLVFWRGSRSGWQGHVGFYQAEDASHYHVLGGNQSDAVTVSRIAKSRLLDARWPTGWSETGNPIHVTAGGIPVTENEA